MSLVSALLCWVMFLFAVIRGQWLIAGILLIAALGCLVAYRWAKRDEARARAQAAEADAELDVFE